MSPPLGRRRREAKQKSWRLRMKKGSVDAKRIGEGSWEEGWCESRCDVKKSRKVGNEAAVSKKENPLRIHSNYEEQ
jgi:hypothetical protein